jgi:hypothetical protein
MRFILGVTTAIGLMLASIVTPAHLALPLILGTFAIAASDEAMAGSRHRKGTRQKSHSKSRHTRNTKTVIVDRDVHVHHDHDDDAGKFIGGLIVGATTATIINEAAEDD